MHCPVSRLGRQKLHVSCLLVLEREVRKRSGPRPTEQCQRLALLDIRADAKGLASYIRDKPSDLSRVQAVVSAYLT